MGKQLPLYKTEEDEVMVLMERVNEAQRQAKLVNNKNKISNFLLFSNQNSFTNKPFKIFHIFSANERTRRQKEIRQKT